MKTRAGFLMFGLLACLGSAVWGGEGQDPVVVYSTRSGFEEVIENIKLAVTERGLLVSGTLHVSEMLNRTGPDLGFPKAVYAKAESVEFCSAALSQRMIAVDPRNLVVCPFTVAAYVLADQPDRVYVAYRKLQLAGAATEETRAVMSLLDEVARAGAE